MSTKPIIVLDVETTGIYPQLDSIVSLGAVFLDGDTLEQTNSYYSLVRPVAIMTDEAQRIHGLTLEQLYNAPTAFSVMNEFYRLIPLEEKPIIAGHNVSFDVSFLKLAVSNAGLCWAFDYHTIDTWTLAYVLLGSQLKNKRITLDTICDYFCISRAKEHNALEDARITAEILRRFVRDNKPKDKETGMSKLLTPEEIEALRSSFRISKLENKPQATRTAEDVATTLFEYMEWALGDSNPLHGTTPPNTTLVNFISEIESAYDYPPADNYFIVEYKDGSFYKVLVEPIEKEYDGIED